MTVSRTTITDNLSRIRDRIHAAATRAGRPAHSVRLVAVTKTVGIEEMRILLDTGVRDLGENRVEVAAPKIAEIGRDAVTWHMIGSVQRRKAREVVTHFDTVDAVDRVELAEVLQKRCEEQSRRIRALIEVNVSGETQKHGFAPAELEAALDRMHAFDRLTVEGLMTMAPLGAPEPALRRIFADLRACAERFRLREISMGMSEDFEIAVEEGATQVRIGTALFV